MSEKQITPMKKLSYNLRLLRQQLSNNFDVLELTETQSHSYRYEYTKGVKSDYILIFTSKSNKEVNFAFTFNYKGELESDYTIDVTIKEKDGNIKTINKFSYVKFKEVLNNMVSLGIRDQSIINFILLLENVEDEEVNNIVNKQKEVYDDLENKLKSSKEELYNLSEEFDKLFICYTTTVKNSLEYKEFIIARDKLELANKELTKLMRNVVVEVGMQKLATTLSKKSKNYVDIFKTNTIKPKKLEELRYNYSLKHGWCKHNLESYSSCLVVPSSIR